MAKKIHVLYITNLNEEEVRNLWEGLESRNGFYVNNCFKTKVPKIFDVGPVYLKGSDINRANLREGKLLIVETPVSVSEGKLSNIVKEILPTEKTKLNILNYEADLEYRTVKK